MDDGGLVDELSLKADPGLSDRQHAKRVGVDQKTVGPARARLEATEEIPQLPTSTGRDGKTRRRPLPEAFDDAVTALAKAAVAVLSGVPLPALAVGG